MNEEQLKEIAILAKELGFKPRTLSTGVTFEKFTRVDKGLPLNDTCYYLLLCEIQLWLLSTPDIHVEILRYTDNTFSAQLCGDRFFYAYNDENAPFEAFDCKSLPDALTIAILEALKLIKNESN